MRPHNRWVLTGRCLVIEDSEMGVRAALAAGMPVWHFAGGAHIQAGYRLPPMSLRPSVDCRCRHLLHRSSRASALLKRLVLVGCQHRKPCDTRAWRANPKPKMNGLTMPRARAGFITSPAIPRTKLPAKLGVSRQTAQRLVSLAVTERLIKVRLDHPLGRCLELVDRLKDAFRACTVAKLCPPTRFHLQYAWHCRSGCCRA